MVLWMVGPGAFGAAPGIGVVDVVDVVVRVVVALVASSPDVLCPGRLGRGGRSAGWAA